MSNIERLCEEQQNSAKNGIKQINGFKDLGKMAQYCNINVIFCIKWQNIILKKQGAYQTIGSILMQ